MSAPAPDIHALAERFHAYAESPEGQEAFREAGRSWDLAAQRYFDCDYDMVCKIRAEATRQSFLGYHEDIAESHRLMSETARKYLAGEHRCGYCFAWCSDLEALLRHEAECHFKLPLT